MTPEFDDAPDFIGHVEQVVNGVVRRHLPETLVLIKINNWFGSKWLGFSGKALGALGVWNKPRNEPADNTFRAVESCIATKLCSPDL